MCLWRIGFVRPWRRQLVSSCAGGSGFWLIDKDPSTGSTCPLGASITARVGVWALAARPACPSMFHVKPLLPRKDGSRRAVQERRRLAFGESSSRAYWRTRPGIAAHEKTPRPQDVCSHAGTLGRRNALPLPGNVIGPEVAGAEPVVRGFQGRHGRRLRLVIEAGGQWTRRCKIPLHLNRQPDVPFCRSADARVPLPIGP